jgi:hypothetical protein
MDSAGLGTACTCPQTLENAARRVLHTAHSPDDCGCPFFVLGQRHRFR